MGSIIGSVFGGDQQASAATNAAGILSGAANNAGALEQQYLTQGMGSVQSGLNQGLLAVNNANGQATAQLNPYNYSGYNALDALNQSLGLATPQGGSFGLAQDLQKSSLANNNQQQITNFYSNNPSYKAMVDTATNLAGIGQNDPLRSAPIPDQIAWMNNLYFNQLQPGQSLADAPGAAQLRQELAANLANSSSQYNTLQQNLSQNQLNPQQQALVNSFNNGNLLNNNSPGSGPGSPSYNALQSFFSTPQYQLQFGNSGTAVDPNASPLQRFQSSPGYQFELGQGLQALQNQASASGLLGSAPMAKGLLNYSQGLANQDWNNYMGRLTNTYGSYQNSLASLAGLGANTSSNLANIYTNTGNNTANLQQNAANTTAGLYSNIGSALGNATLAAAAAKAGGIVNAANINAANSQAGGALGSFLGPSLFGDGTSGSGLFGTGLSSTLSSGIGGILGGLS